MNVKEVLVLENITSDYFSFKLSKIDNEATLYFNEISIVFSECNILKCGYPNEEIYMHYNYYTQDSMRKYILYEMLQSDWIKTLENMNQIHPRHSEKIFQNQKHFIIMFEDEVFECIAASFMVVKD